MGKLTTTDIASVACLIMSAYFIIKDPTLTVYLMPLLVVIFVFYTLFLYFLRKKRKTTHTIAIAYLITSVVLIVKDPTLTIYLMPLLISFAVLYSFLYYRSINKHQKEMHE